MIDLLPQSPVEAVEEVEAEVVEEVVVEVVEEEVVVEVGVVRLQFYP
jgi:hypothetical protein